MADTLSETLRKAMVVEGAARLARRIGISRTALYDLSKGKTPRPQTLRKLRRARIALPATLMEAI